MATPEELEEYKTLLANLAEKSLALAKIAGSPMLRRYFNADLQEDDQSIERVVSYGYGNSYLYQLSQPFQFFNRGDERITARLLSNTYSALTNLLDNIDKLDRQNITEETPLARDAWEETTKERYELEAAEFERDATSGSFYDASRPKPAALDLSDEQYEKYVSAIESRRQEAETEMMQRQALTAKIKNNESYQALRSLVESLKQAVDKENKYEEARHAEQVAQEKIKKEQELNAYKRLNDITQNIINNLRAKYELKENSGVLEIERTLHTMKNQNEKQKFKAVSAIATRRIEEGRGFFGRLMTLQREPDVAKFYSLLSSAQPKEAQLKELEETTKPEANKLSPRRPA